MATWTEADLAELEANMKEGVLSIGHGDKRVTFRSMADMKDTRRMMIRSLRSQPRKTSAVASHSRD